MRKNSQQKNVFCLEGLWENNLKVKSSVEPVLQLLEKNGTSKYVQRDCATITEFEYYLRKWGTKAYKDYPVLYLAFHGSQNEIHMEDGSRTLEEISEILEGVCRGRIIILGSCDTLNVDLRRIKNFLRKTGALAVCGYKEEIEWNMSSAFELLLIDGLQGNEFSLRGIDSIASRLKILSERFPELCFRVVTQKEIS